MPDERLFNYIKEQLQKGVGREEIKNALLSKGWQEEDIDRAFYSVLEDSNQLSESPILSVGNSSLPGAIAILKQALSIYDRKFGALLSTIVINIGIAGLLMVVLPLACVILFSSGVALLGWIIYYVSLFFSALIALILLQTTLVYALKNEQRGLKAIIKSYYKGFKKILSYWYLWLLLLIGNYILLTILGGNGPTVLFFVSGLDIISSVIVLTIIGLDVVGLVLFWPIFVLATEDLKSLSARKKLSKLREMIEGKWIGVFWRLLFLIIVILILLIPLIILIRVNRSIFIICSLAELVLLPPLITAYSFSLYSNLKVTKQLPSK